MILGLHREAPLVGIEARSARHREAREHAADLESQVVVTPRRVVEVNDVSAGERPRRVVDRRLVAERLVRRGWASLAVVLTELLRCALHGGVRSLLRTRSRISEYWATLARARTLLVWRMNMSSPDRQEAASRHFPVAHQRNASGVAREKAANDHRHPSEIRLQVAVVRQTPRDERDERDPYADVPCTD